MSGNNAIDFYFFLIERYKTKALLLCYQLSTVQMEYV